MLNEEFFNDFGDLFLSKIDLRFEIGSLLLSFSSCLSYVPYVLKVKLPFSSTNQPVNIQTLDFKSELKDLDNFDFVAYLFHNPLSQVNNSNTFPLQDALSCVILLVDRIIYLKHIYINQNFSTNRRMRIKHKLDDMLNIQYHFLLFSLIINPD